MPTIPRLPVAQRERVRLEVRRLRADEMFAVGVRQAEVAHRFGCLPAGREPVACPLEEGWHRRAAQPWTDRARAQVVRPGVRRVERALLTGAAGSGHGRRT